MACDITDFEQDVIARSHECPVLADFWAAWCGPCRVLGPVLEKLAADANGQWVLAKVDTEQFPELSARFGIRGIPAVKLFVDGAVVGEFTGALPEAAIRQFLDRHLPNEMRALVDAAYQALEAGEPLQARSLIESALALVPGDEAARVLLARLTLTENPGGALTLVEGIRTQSDHHDQAEAIRLLATQLRRAATELPDGKGRDDLAAALDALKCADWPTAFPRLIDVVRKDRRYEDDLARRLCLALFRLLGDRHPLTGQWRRALGSALH